jgi:predicted nucleic acid-binding protein
MIVVDASCAVKWIVAEPDDDKALKLLNGAESLIAPDLVMVEVANAIARRVRDQRLSVVRAEEAYAKWTRLLQRESLELMPSAALVDRAFAMSLKAAHPVADCLYIACAESIDATVVTADRDMADRGLRVYPHVQLLGKAA